ncbi:HD domain-containing protein [Glaciimonas sp. GG7]
MSESAAYFRYWGKAQPSEDGAAALHLLPFHCLDVAAVGTLYLQQSPSLLKSCCDLLNCTESAFLSWSALVLSQ